MKTRTKIIIASVIAFLLICCIVLYIVGVSIYNGVFQVRFTTNELTKFHLSEFDGLKCEESGFTSNDGQKIAGYKYYSDAKSPKGVLVFAHGFGAGGQCGYMNIFNFFASNGYIVYAYDATGNDLSEGEVIGGFPQGVIDLDYALNHVKAQEWSKDLPIALMGYSWGSYCVNNVLTFHPDVKAVVSVSGFNSSMDLIEYEGVNMVGPIAYTMLPFAKLNEIFKYGKYARNTALDGFKKSDASVLIIHSTDDTTVPVRYGYDKYFEKYGESDRFEFISFANRGHSNIFVSKEYLDYNESYDKLLKEYESSLGREMTSVERNDFYKVNYDRSKYVNNLDKALFNKILRFLDENI
jgi:alpha-beta hydrolase superfamily lysophospholipase